MKFPQRFDSFACIGDTLRADADGFVIHARIEYDHDSHIDDDDCHNIDQSVTGCNDEQQQKLLASREAWFNDEWQYCGIVLSVSREGVELDSHAASLWSIECNYPDSDNEHLTEVANELLPEAIDEARKVLRRLCASAA